VACQDLEGMSPLEFFVEEIENEDVYVRLEAYRRVRLIAGALGPQMTEQKLLPLLLGEKGEREGGMGRVITGWGERGWKWKGGTWGHGPAEGGEGASQGEED